MITVVFKTQFDNQSIDLDLHDEGECEVLLTISRYHTEDCTFSHGFGVQHGQHTVIDEVEVVSVNGSEKHPLMTTASKKLLELIKEAAIEFEIEYLE